MSLTYVLGAQKNRVIETVLLSTHNICFGWEIRKLFSWYALLTKGLINFSRFYQTYTLLTKTFLLSTQSIYFDKNSYKSLQDFS